MSSFRSTRRRPRPVADIDELETIAENLRQLGADHRKFDVEARHYEIAGQALLNPRSNPAQE